MNDRPTFIDFCFNYPMYAEVSFAPDEEDGDDDEEVITINDYFDYTGRSDGYCVECSDRTVFICEKNIKSVFQIQYSDFINTRYVAAHFKCARDENHHAVFYFLQTEWVWQKIGQHPSLADTAIGELDRFRKVLETEDSREFKKALGLAAHDVGIGSFVYLRRVLERLVDSRKNEAIAAGAHKPEDFEGKRVSERIKLLKGFLPDVLVSNKKIYTVLSKGVHELSEEECLKYFPVLRELMFLVLEEDLEKKRKVEHLNKAEKALKKI